MELCCACGGRELDGPPSLVIHEDCEDTSSSIVALGKTCEEITTDGDCPI